jgi:uncharacterized membrane protein HdeD (DUF308 family)
MLRLIIVGIFSIHSAQNQPVDIQWKNQIISEVLGILLYLGMASWTIYYAFKIAIGFPLLALASFCSF